MTLTFELGLAGAAAYYDDTPYPRIVVGLSPVIGYLDFDEFEEKVFALKADIRHEVLHYTQSLMAYFLGQEDEGDYAPTTPQAGLPSKGSMTPEFRGHYEDMGKTRKRHVRKVLEKAESLGIRWSMHSADDVEFYTVLVDGIEEFKRGSRGMPEEAKRKWLLWYTGAYRKPSKPGKKRRVRPPDELANWVGSDKSEFFLTLKKVAPRKYRKALSEFYKAIL